MRIARGLLVTILVLGLCGCATVREDIIPPTAGKTARAVDRYCTEMAGLIVFREEFVNKVNQYTDVGNLTALDCDGDGEPDFGAGPAETDS